MITKKQQHQIWTVWADDQLATFKRTYERLI